MFQSFRAVSTPELTAVRVGELRRLLAAHKLDAFLVPRADEHQGEYVPPASERLRWLTGFSGSAGLACVTRKHAGLFVDGRYKVQVRIESDLQLFELPENGRPKLDTWLKEKLAKGQTVGFDPWLHTIGEIGRLEEPLAAKGIKLKPVRKNLVDLAWGRERPPPPAAPIVPHPLEYSGRPAADKIADIQKRLKEDGQDGVILTLSDSVCWTFNIRGSDVAHNPVALAFAYVPQSGKAELFASRGRLDAEARTHLDPVARLVEPAKLAERIAALRGAGKRVRLDPETAAWWFAHALGGSKGFVRGADPCRALKAVKNRIEIKGARAAHVRDGVAMVRYLAWLDRTAPKGILDEMEAVRALESFRAETRQLKEIAFDTISGSGPNGAIVHYRVSEGTNRRLQPGELFLIDSGAQYLDGTTDITRTVAIGQPTAEMCERFTLVLKGHIAIAMARFPAGTRGIDLDPFARRALWEAGLDYDHGTGHGVGSYLSVHEGPQSISRAGTAELKAGMIISNEPGYYKEGHYGIRIENLVLVKEAEKPAGAEKALYEFDTLTLVPIDRRLVAKEMLTAGERNWLDIYHARVREALSPNLDPESRAWLEAATAPI